MSNVSISFDLIFFLKQYCHCFYLLSYLGFSYNVLTAFIGQQKMKLKNIRTFLLLGPFLNDFVFAVLHHERADRLSKT